MENVLIKPIKGYEGYYDITSDGRIFSKERIINKRKYGGVWRSPFRRSKEGYLQILLYNNMSVKGYYIHRLLAQHFIPNPENKPQINHINFKRDDNRIENLEWCTDQENKQHSKINGRTARGEKQHMSKLTEEQVKEIRKNHIPRILAKKKPWKKYNISNRHYNQIIKRRRWVWLENG